MKKFWIVKSLGNEKDEFLKSNKDGTNKKYFCEADAVEMAKKLTGKYKSRFAVFSLHKAYSPPNDVVELEIDITDDLPFG